MPVLWHNVRPPHQVQRGWNECVKSFIPAEWGAAAAAVLYVLHESLSLLLSHSFDVICNNSVTLYDTLLSETCEYMVALISLVSNDSNFKTVWPDHLRINVPGFWKKKLGSTKPEYLTLPLFTLDPRYTIRILYTSVIAWLYVYNKYIITTCLNFLFRSRNCHGRPRRLRRLKQLQRTRQLQRIQKANLPKVRTSA